MTSSVPLWHLLEQGDVVASLGKTAVTALLPRSKERPPTPGPWIERELAPRRWSLVRDYVRHVGGDPWAYVGHLPPHLFPQWSFALAAKTLGGVPYPLARALNAGCRIEVRKPLPLDEPLHVKARLESINDDGRRAILVQRVITSTPTAVDALDCEMRVFVPLGGPKAKDAEKKAPEAPPTDAEELRRFDVDAHAGRDFAVLTGDVNPIHWVPAYARAAGFRGTILHGFATLARAFEALVQSRGAGKPQRLRTIDVRFLKPLGLPGHASVFARGDRVWVADAKESPAYLAGTFQMENSR